LMKKGDYTKSIVLLNKIMTEYPDDVLADDASFLEAEIYEMRLNQKEKAKEKYRLFLDKHAGSVYAAEARKRYRTLRGDFVENKDAN
ncbi:MAG: tetratricopeptide repeat protein, partial [Flammeovirgaceae bacterium]